MNESEEKMGKYATKLRDDRYWIKKDDNQEIEKTNIETNVIVKELKSKYMENFKTSTREVFYFFMSFVSTCNE